MIIGYRPVHHQHIDVALKVGVLPPDSARLYTDIWKAAPRGEDEAVLHAVTTRKDIIPIGRGAVVFFDKMLLGSLYSERQRYLLESCVPGLKFSNGYYSIVIDGGACIEMIWDGNMVLPEGLPLFVVSIVDTATPTLRDASNAADRPVDHTQEHSQQAPS